MPAYNSTFLAEETPQSRVIGNMAILPIRSQYKGPSFGQTLDYDIIDEVIDLFRANTFFKNFEIKGAADRTLIYGILFVSQCLNSINLSSSKNDAIRTLTNLALDNFDIPGDVGFPLNSLYQAPREKSESTLLRQYIQQFRQELAMRLIERLYQDDISKPSKFWLAFNRKKFMNKSL
ncbi:Arc18 protein [Martiniozyma asiatica (nom. inval.)]|nr:Arc18 protein [Martiniozyma asiatica]